MLTYVLLMLLGVDQIAVCLACRYISVCNYPCQKTVENNALELLKAVLVKAESL